MGIVCAVDAVALGSCGRGACVSRPQSFEHIALSCYVSYGSRTGSWGFSYARIRVHHLAGVVFLTEISVTRLVWVLVAQSCGDLLQLFFVQNCWVFQASLNWAIIRGRLCLTLRNNSKIWLALRSSSVQANRLTNLLARILVVVKASRLAACINDIACCTLYNTALRDAVVFHVLINRRNGLHPLFALILLYLLFAWIRGDLHVVWDISSAELSSLSYDLCTLVEVTVKHLLHLKHLLVVKELLLLGWRKSLRVNVVGHVDARSGQEACGFVQGILITDLVLRRRQLSIGKLVVDDWSTVGAAWIGAADAAFVLLVELVVDIHGVLCSI